MGLDPAVIHLNEGHPALAALELVTQRMADGASADDAFDEVRKHFVFTTHTPVAAGQRDLRAGRVPRRVRLARQAARARRRGISRSLPLARATPTPGMTPLALKVSRKRNGVSKLHGEVAREMWRPLFGNQPETPITHVTNGVHMPSWVSEPMRDLFTRHLDGDWHRAPANAASWEGVQKIPNDELWAARCESRARLVEFVRAKAGQDSLLRGEQLDYVRWIESSLDPDTLTIGFARRLATYKRFHLLAHDPDRARRIFTGEHTAQLVIAGKAHPNDEPGKDALQRFYAFEHGGREISGRVVIVEDYDIGIARAARRRLRPLGQPAPQADGGERHERHEDDLQRRAPAERPRRLVGRGLQRLERLGDPRRRRRRQRPGCSRCPRRRALLRPAGERR